MSDINEIVDSQMEQSTTHLTKTQQKKKEPPNIHFTTEKHKLNNHSKLDSKIPLKEKIVDSRKLIPLLVPLHSESPKDLLGSLLPSSEINKEYLFHRQNSCLPSGINISSCI